MNEKEFNKLYGDDSQTKQLRESVKVLTKSLDNSPFKDDPEILKLKVAAKNLVNCSEKTNNDFDMSFKSKTLKDCELAFKAFKLSNTLYIDATNIFFRLFVLEPKVNGKLSYYAQKVYYTAKGYL